LPLLIFVIADTRGLFMKFVRLGSSMAACLLATVVSSAAAQDRMLTPDAVLDLVAAQNAEVVLARARAAQALGALTTARARLPENPGVTGFLGSRDSLDGSRAFEAELSISQRFEIAGQRGHRIAASTAVVGQRNADVEATVLEAQRVALAALYRAAHAQQRRELGDAAVKLAEEAARAAQGRYEAGDTAILDVNVAKVEVARATREQLAAAAQLEGAVGELREILALPPDARVTVHAPLALASASDAALPTLDVLMARVQARPDVKSLEAAAVQAEAELKLARAERLPDVVGGFGLRREEREPVIGGIFGISIPVFQRQTGAIATATARVTEAKAAVQARVAILSARLHTAYARFSLAARAADAIAATALPLTVENEKLTGESYQAGKIGQLELLVIRREGFAARREALDAQLDAMLAALDVRGVAGMLR
jgi:outer membrane protein, heavy metal efflux system